MALRQKKFFSKWIITTKFLLGLVMGSFIPHLLWDYCLLSPVVKQRQYPAVMVHSRILVAIMTSEKYINTRCAAVGKTWGRNAGVDFVHFLGEKAKYSGSLNVVRLQGVSDDVYPPQRKMFEMMKYLYRHYIGDYLWFVRADDDIYIRVEKLKRFLMSIDPQRVLYMGKKGQGRKHEKNRLGLGSAFHYCMGGSGVVFSRAALLKLGADLDTCAVSTATRHEDTELGRCVKRYLHVNCTLPKQAANSFHEIYGNLGRAELQRISLLNRKITTIHSVKKPQYLFQIHWIFLHHRLEDQRLKVLRLNSEITSASDLIHSLKNFGNVAAKEFRRYINGSELFGILHEHPNDVYSQEVHWDAVNGNHIYSNNNNYYYLIKVNLEIQKRGNLFYKSKSLTTASLQDNLRHALTLKEHPFSYLKLFPSFGYVCKFSYSGNFSGIKQLNFSVLSVTRFGPLKYLAVPKTATSEKLLTVLVPLSGRLHAFQRFLGNLLKTSAQQRGRVELLVVFFFNEDWKKIIKYGGDVEKKLGNFTFRHLILQGSFSRSKALREGIRVLSIDSLVLVLDVDVAFGGDIFHQARKNAIRNRRAYFPIIFSQYNPSLACGNSTLCSENPFNYTRNRGMWRYYGYGIVAIYKSDILKVGNFPVGVHGWGGEDVTFYLRCLHSPLSVIRASEPSLVHVYHNKVCPGTLKAHQRSMCSNSRSWVYGSPHVLSAYIYETPDILNRK